MHAVIDDAERDSRTVEKGTLLDIALVGAIRKGAQAARVSYATGVALAELLGLSDYRLRLTAAGRAHQLIDDALSDHLSDLTRSPTNAW
jgi:hypothetical protein